MKHKRVLLASGLLAAVLVGAVCRHNYLEAQKDLPLIPPEQHFSYVLLRQEGEEIEYFNRDSSDVYNFFSNLHLKRAETLPLGRWRYTAILPRAHTFGADPQLPNDGTTCVIRIYPGFLEIDGTAYLPAEDLNMEMILEWLDNHYDHHSQNYTVYHL